MIGSALPNLAIENASASFTPEQTAANENPLVQVADRRPGSGPGFAPPAPAIIPVPAPIPSASGGVDTVKPSPSIRPLPKLDFGLPNYESDELPDNMVPGMAQGLENIMNNVPKDEVLLREMAVKELRKKLNQDYQAQQRQLRLHNEQVKTTSDLTQQEYMNRFAKEYVDRAKIETDDRLTADAKRTLVHYQMSIDKDDPQPQVDKANWAEYLQRITAPYGTPGKILDQNEIIAGATGADKKFGRASLENLLKHFHDQRDASTNAVIPKQNQFINAYKPFVEGPENYAAMDESREARFFNFVNALSGPQGLVEQYRKDNKDPMSVFTLTDPKDQFSSPAGKLAKQFEAPYRAMFAPAPPAGAPTAVGLLTPDQQKRFMPPNPEKLSAEQANTISAEIKAAIGKEITGPQARELLMRLGLKPPKPPSPQPPTGR